MKSNYQLLKSAKLLQDRYTNVAQLRDSRRLRMQQFHHLRPLSATLCAFASLFVHSSCIQQTFAARCCLVGWCILQKLIRSRRAREAKLQSLNSEECTYDRRVGSVGDYDIASRVRSIKSDARYHSFLDQTTRPTRSPTHVYSERSLESAVHWIGIGFKERELDVVRGQEWWVRVRVRVVVRRLEHVRRHDPVRA